MLSLREVSWAELAVKPKETKEGRWELKFGLWEMGVVEESSQRKPSGRGQVQATCFCVVYL